MGVNRYGQKWSVEETILAFYLYCQIPFSKISKNNPDVIALANLLGRTPSSVGLKMANLAHFDPELKKRCMSGMNHASKLDEEVVMRFVNNWEELSFEAKQIEAQLKGKTVDELININLKEIPEGSNHEQLVMTRVNQQFFRDAVLCSYQQSCCITGISVPALLIASHIKPWSVCDPKTERTNPSNGLCLNALHDRAFDKGLITVLPDFTIRVSSTIRQSSNEKSIDWLLQFEGQTIHKPDRFVPSKEFLEYHNDAIFIP